MIAYLIQVTICMAIFYGFYLIALQKETTFQINRIYLISTVVISLILPLIKIYIESNPASSSATEVYFIGNYFDSLQQAVIVPAEDKVIKWVDSVNNLYVAGCLVMAFRLGIEIVKILNLNNNGTRLNVSGCRCILSEKIKSPFSFFRTIYLPANHGFNEEELAEVLEHEHSHISGRHSIDVLFMEIVKIFLWISPMIYLYRIKLREVHEFLADAAVIKNSPWEKYAQFLVSQKYVGLQNHLSNQLIYSQLKNRLIMMTQRPSSMLAKWKYIGVLPLFLMALLIFSFRQKEISNATNPSVNYSDMAITSIDDNTEQPLFPGCEKVNEMEKADCSHKKMYEYVASHLKYPEDMKVNKVEGKVYVKFVITNNGLVADARIQKSLNPAADKAALDVMNGMNDNVGKWTPGTKEGIPVTMDMVLPISFVLSSGPGATSDSSSNSSSIANSNTEVYSYVEEMPMFPDGQDAMYKFIYEKIKYPAQAREKGISGQVIVQFIVSSEGDIYNSKVLRGIGGGCDEEVLRLVNEMPRWIPGKHDGQSVAVSFTLPVKFVLQAENEVKDKPASTPIEENPPANQTVVTALAPSVQIANSPTNNDLHLSPNPARDHTVIDLFEGAKTIFIFTAEGVQIAKVEVTSSMDSHYRLDVTKYTPGQYSVQVVSLKESKSGVFTVIK